MLYVICKNKRKFTKFIFIYSLKYGILDCEYVVEK